MSDDILSLVRANSAAFSDRDVDTMLTYYAPDAVVVDRRPHGLGSFSGHEELRNYYLSIFHSVEAMREHLEVLAERDGVVVAHCELWARLPSDTSGAGFTAVYGLVMRIEDGRIVRLDIHTDGQEALEAAALDR